MQNEAWMTYGWRMDDVWTMDDVYGWRMDDVYGGHMDGARMEEGRSQKDGDNWHDGGRSTVRQEHDVTMI